MTLYSRGEEDFGISMGDSNPVLIAWLPTMVVIIIVAMLISWISKRADTANYPSQTAPDPDALSNGQNRLEDTNIPVLEPKHKIFLSHSGFQKYTFVDQLCKDLEAESHYPFFDQRSHALPKGEKFAKLIFDAAKQCHVAVIVLSEEYLTSKWPMLELGAFVKAQETETYPKLKLLPIFFMLSSEDLSIPSNTKRWEEKWKKFAKEDPRVDVELWTRALKALRAVNGLNFSKYGPSEVAYRAAIVKEICIILPPELLHDTSEVEGRDRLCKLLAGMFVNDTSEDSGQPGAQKLGLYGMGGLGKTTMCKALCNHFHKSFRGRVCHVELGHEAPLTLQKMVLKNMLRLGEEVLQNITNDSLARKCLKDHMKKQPVFLVIDNVGDDEPSRREARAYVEAGFHPDSKIMVTSRSQEIVKALLRDPKYCMPMPDLTKDEATRIFLQKAVAPEKEVTSLTNKETNIVNKCLEQCYFTPDGDNSSSKKREKQYHPLALGALGVYFRDVDSFNLFSWEDHLHSDKLKCSSDAGRIFNILGLKFNTFDLMKKLLFLDVALYSQCGQMGWYLSSFEDWVVWLAALHDEERQDVELKLKHLKRSGMINWGLSSAITTHDLYKEFAEWYTKDEEVKRQCVYKKTAESLLRRNPHGTCWEELTRVSMQKSSWVGIKSWVKVQEWCNVVVLQLQSCSDLRVLDLYGLSSLCHLELIDLDHLESLTFSKYADHTTTVSQRESMPPMQLQFVILSGLKALTHLPSFSPCSFLQKFIIRLCQSLRALPDFQECSLLEALRINMHCCRMQIFKLGTLTSLRDFAFCNSGIGNVPMELKGLGYLTNLQKGLYLKDLPVKSLPGLERLTKLRLLSLEHCSLLSHLPDLSALVHLEVFVLSYTKVGGIPGVDKLSQLQTLDCRWCQELQWLPDLHELSNLRFLSTRGCAKLMTYPRVPTHSCVHDKDERSGKKRKGKQGDHQSAGDRIRNQPSDPYDNLDTKFYLQTFNISDDES